MVFPFFTIELIQKTQPLDVQKGVCERDKCLRKRKESRELSFVKLPGKALFYLPYLAGAPFKTETPSELSQGPVRCSPLTQSQERGSVAALRACQA